MFDAGIGERAEAVIMRSGKDKCSAGIIRILAGAESTDASFSIVEYIEPPASGATLHVNPHEWSSPHSNVLND